MPGPLFWTSWGAGPLFKVSHVTLMCRQDWETLTLSQPHRETQAMFGSHRELVTGAALTVHSIILSLSSASKFLDRTYKYIFIFLVPPGLVQPEPLGGF
jgi:hypothetical protein